MGDDGDDDMMMVTMTMMSPPSTKSEYSELFYHLPIESQHWKLYNRDFLQQLRFLFAKLKPP